MVDDRIQRLCRNLVTRKCKHGFNCLNQECIAKKCNQTCTYSHDLTQFKLIFVSTKSFYDHANVYSQEKLVTIVLARLKQQVPDVSFVCALEKYLVYSVKKCNDDDTLREWLDNVDFYIDHVGGQLYVDRNRTFNDQIYDASFIVPYNSIQRQVFLARKKNNLYPIGGKRDYNNTQDDAWDCAVREFLEETYNGSISQQIVDMRDNAFEEVYEENHFIMTFFFIDVAYLNESLLFTQEHVDQINTRKQQWAITKQEEEQLAKYISSRTPRSHTITDPMLIEKLTRANNGTIVTDLNTFYHCINNVTSGENQSLFITELDDFGWVNISDLTAVNSNVPQMTDYVVQGVQKAEAIKQWGN
jgi:hypothetical protein